MTRPDYRLVWPLILCGLACLPGQVMAQEACKAVGLTPGRQGGLTFHDTRRTAVRNLIRAGVDQTVAKKISGHRTDSTFDRYNITSEDDLRDAVEKVAAYVDTLPTDRKVAVIGGEGGPNTAQRLPKGKGRTRS